MDTARRRVRILRDTLTIVSNDDKFPKKAVYFSGLWQRQGESNNEPYAREIIDAFGFKTNTGFYYTDITGGDTTSAFKGDEIRPSYFVRVDTFRPVSIRQMAAYHGCCTQTERIVWYPKGSLDSQKIIVSHIGPDAQSLLPREGRPSIAATGSISPVTAFGLKIGGNDNTDARQNPGGKIGVRVWKAFDAKRARIPNSYIISNDYLGNPYTNYDYNDNMYFVTNVRPEVGSANFSALATAPSALDFGEKLLQSTDSLTLNLSSLGQIYPDSSKDPVITISSVVIVGENQSEFTASMPVKNTLNPQDSTTITVYYRPVSQGLKIADLLINYNNSQSPRRVPLYGIAKGAQTTVTANYRIKSGSATPMTINGKIWGADDQYAFDNLEPFTNNKLTQIAGTDEDSLYLKEQSSNADKRPFRYELPLENGDYVVRLHFAEIYWGSPGSGLNGGAGSRVMNVSLEDSLRLVNFDVIQEVGPATALVKNIPVTVTDGKLNIDFS
ncbi:MAG TPA: malectin domain-containing carbohydrate-binding protein, partial [Segetibacter sp.]